MSNERTTAYRIEEGLFVDRLLIDRLDGATLRLHEPVSGGKAIAIDKTREGPENEPVSAFVFEGRFRLYYRAMTVSPGDESADLCVALSDDGAGKRSSS